MKSYKLVISILCDAKLGALTPTSLGFKNLL
jgi:hypothetical protein